MAGAVRNSLTLERTQPMVDLVMNEKNARNIVERLQPIDKLLFGGHFAVVAHNLKDRAIFIFTLDILVFRPSQGKFH